MQSYDGKEITDSRVQQADIQVMKIRFLHIFL